METAADLSKPPFLVRAPEPADYEAVRQVVAAAFADGGGVAALVEVLRATWAHGDGFELVTESDGRITGHIGMTAGYVDARDRLVRVLILSPLAVAPGHQGTGLGSALVRAALARAQRAGYGLVFLEGVPAFYPKLGFVPAGGAGFGKPSERIPDAAFMVAILDPDAAERTGRLVYPDAFWRADAVGLRGENLRRMCPALFDGGAR